MFTASQWLRTKEHALKPEVTWVTCETDLLPRFLVRKHKDILGHLSTGRSYCRWGLRTTGWWNSGRLLLFILSEGGTQITYIFTSLHKKQKMRLLWEFQTAVSNQDCLFYYSIFILLNIYLLHRILGTSWMSFLKSF